MNSFLLIENREVEALDVTLLLCELEFEVKGLENGTLRRIIFSAYLPEQYLSPHKFYLLLYQST